MLAYVSAYQALQSASHTLLAAGRAGLGIAVISRIMARMYDDLVPVSADVARHDPWLVAHPDGRREPKTRAVADFLKRAARSMEL